MQNELKQASQKSQTIADLIENKIRALIGAGVTIWGINISELLEAQRKARYAGWDTPAAQAMLKGSLDQAAARVTAEKIEPQPRSGKQERLENLWNRYV